jgi:Cu(I)/Ag(I) efflux system membrane fusion protein/cobalt-zinc-cadmium efflux system membrane fusion protein
VATWLSSASGSPGSGSAQSGTADDGEQWYTCGMHPNVLQVGPGNCPICQMKLTPLKKDSAGDKAAGGPGERSILYWRAPMDPNFVSDRPGKSPMGMDLVPVYADQEESPSAHTIRIDPVTVQNMGIRTTTVKRGPLIKTIRSVGRVDYDEQRVTFFNTKFEGWIEELHVAETGRQVQEGQALFDVFSRDLWEAQAAFLASLNLLERIEDATYTQAREDAVLQLEADRMRLRNYDITDEQIAELADTREVRRVLAIHSPAGGIVTDKMALEGMYVKPGMKLYTIADLSRVWVYVDIYEYQLPWVSLGQTATMTLPYVPGRVFVGKVVYIYPYLEQQKPGTQARHVRQHYAGRRV